MIELVTPLPGTGCRYFTGGHCVRKLKADPSLHDIWRCSVLEQWEQAFDAYLDQVECFKLDQETIMSIWTKRFEDISDNPVCEDLIPGEDSVIGCALLHFDLCRIKMPACPGRCRYFERHQP